MYNSAKNRAVQRRRVITRAEDHLEDHRGPCVESRKTLKITGLEIEQWVVLGRGNVHPLLHYMQDSWFGNTEIQHRFHGSVCPSVYFKKIYTSGFVYPCESLMWNEETHAQVSLDRSTQKSSNQP